MSIFDVRHQRRAHRLIQRTIAGDRMPHAYIFHGPEGVGREMFASRLAGVLLCEQPASLPSEGIDGFDDWSGSVLDACNGCDACRMSEADTHPDFHLIYRELIKHHPDAAVRTRKGIDLGVDVIREFVIDRVGLKPTQGRAKVFVVRDAQTMSSAAQNALLKTLEEPPATTFLILIVSALDALLPTTRSRCQLVPFDPLPDSFIVEQLTAMNTDLSPEQARWCAAVACGSLGLAVCHLEDGLDAHNDRLGEVLAGLAEASPTELTKPLIDQAKQLGELQRKRDNRISETEAQRRGLKMLFALMSGWYRDALSLSTGADVCRVNSEHPDRIERLAGPLSVRNGERAIRAIATAERQLDLNANVQLCIDSLLIGLARLTRGDSSTRTRATA